MFVPYTTPPFHNIFLERTEAASGVIPETSRGLSLPPGARHRGRWLSAERIQG